MKKILFVYSRDIDINDSGGSRTTIELMNTLACSGRFVVYSFFRILDGASDKITQCPYKDSFEKELFDLVCRERIEIVMVPEAVVMCTKVKQTLKHTNVKIVTALHNMPGYEAMNINVMLWFSLLKNNSFIKRFRALCLLSIFPIFKFAYVSRLRKQFRMAYESSDKLVLLSEYFFDDFCKIYKVNNSSKLVAIGNALSFDYFATEEDIINKKKQILVVSRLSEESKRISRILKMWKEIQNKLPDWELIIVGFGRAESYYKEWSKKHNLQRVSFEGKHPPLQYYKEASIFLMTSDFEGWGMTITEAQQCGTVPIVLNTFASLKELVTDGKNGFSPNDMEEFQNDVLKVACDEHLRKNIALTCIDTSRRFVRELIHEKYINLFESL